MGVLGLPGGHATDNSEEFLASLISSLLHPKWEEKVKSLGLDFQVRYYRSLRALSVNLASMADFSKNAPIISDVNNKLQTLEWILLQTPEGAAVVMPYFQLSKKPASDK